MYIVLQRVITHRGDDWNHRKTRAKALDTKIEVIGVDAEASSIIEIKCSTRVRKPSAIANIDSKYAPFSFVNTERKLTV